LFEVQLVDGAPDRLFSLIRVVLLIGRSSRLCRRREVRGRRRLRLRDEIGVRDLVIVSDAALGSAPRRRPLRARGHRAPASRGLGGEYHIAVYGENIGFCDRCCRFVENKFRAIS